MVWFWVMSVQLQQVSDAGFKKVMLPARGKPPVGFDEIHRGAIKNGKAG
jgi:hypothetical protein